MTNEDVRRGCPLNNLAQEMSPIDSDFRERICLAYSEWTDALEQAIERGKLAGNIEAELDAKSMSLLLVATLGGCMGVAKNMQSLDALICCGRGLIDRMEATRPKP